MILRLTPIAMAITLLCPSAFAMAQQADSKAAQAVPEASASAKPAAAEGATAKGDLAKVEIKGSSSEYDPRREDTASKTVLTHEEIIKYGDTNVFDVLKRAPGVTVIGNSIRMRGLGNGYTQVMVNGERPPPGFSMDALMPDQIDKIEVIRSATAEHSMQAIAGSINIVLKKVVAKPQRDLRVSAGHSGQHETLKAIGTLADRKGNLSYYLNGALTRNLNRTDSDSTDLFTTPEGLQLRDKRSVNEFRSTMAGIQPRLNWKLANDDQLSVSGFIQVQRVEEGGASASTNLVGAFPQPDYVNRQSHGDTGLHFYGADVNWVAKLGGGKLDVKLAMSTGQVNNDSGSLSLTENGSRTFQRDTETTSTYTNYSSTGKYTRTLFADHSLATGYELNHQLNEDDNRRVEVRTGAEDKHIDETFSPEIVRMAAYAQDEWNITKNWSMYLGARWEGIRTKSAGTGLLSTQSRSHVLSPVAQTLYKFPDKSGRQLRMALTRTYKAPNTNQLSARRHETDLNTRFTPDGSGNPDLRPELANGIDLTYEHFWAPGAVFSVGGSARQIKDYIRSKLDQDGSGHWLIRPINEGSAQVRTLDVELKFPLKAIMKDAPPFDFRASVNRNWSKVESVPGPDNRLDQQVPLSAVLGADYKVDKFSAGASFAFRQGGPVRISQEQSSQMQVRRELEAYLLYKIRTGLQLRTAVSNALGQDTLSESRYQDSNGTNQTWSRSKASPRLQVNLEIKY